jgi:hypothetical protein
MRSLITRAVHEISFYLSRDAIIVKHVTIYSNNCEKWLLVGHLMTLEIEILMKKVNNGLNKLWIYRVKRIWYQILTLKISYDTLKTKKIKNSSIEIFCIKLQGQIFQTVMTEDVHKFQLLNETFSLMVNLQRQIHGGDLATALSCWKFYYARLTTCLNRQIRVPLKEININVPALQQYIYRLSIYIQN